MKRIIILLVFLLLITGCVNINNSDYKSIINETINSNKKIYNTYRSGYKFYLPRQLYVVDSTEYNEVIKSNSETYYLYIDIISYLNKKEFEYKKNDESIYSDTISYNDNFGYIEINQVENKYLVEIMYNYAKIEVMVASDNLKSSILNAIVLLSSIYYNDGVLHNLSKENVLSYSEENVDIFSTKGKETSNFLTYDPGIYDEDDYEIPDYDLIK